MLMIESLKISIKQEVVMFASRKSEINRRYLAALAEIGRGYRRIAELKEQKEQNPSRQQVGIITKKPTTIPKSDEDIRIHLLTQLVDANLSHMHMIHKLTEQKKLGLTRDYIEKLIQENTQNRDFLGQMMDHFKANPFDHTLMDQDYREFYVYISRTYALEDYLLGELRIPADDKCRRLARYNEDDNLRSSNSSVAEVMRNALSKRAQQSKSQTKNVVAVSDLKKLELLASLYQKLIQTLMTLKEANSEDLTQFKYAINLRFNQYHQLQFICSDSMNCAYDSYESSVKLARDYFGLSKAFEGIYDKNNNFFADVDKAIKELADQLIEPKKEFSHYYGANPLQMRR